MRDIPGTKRTIAFHTFGCRLNQSETAVIQNSFPPEEYSVVELEEGADIVVINTCTVTENGDEETRRLVRKVNRLNPNARIALIGCQAQVQKDRLTQLPNVRWVVGNARKMDVANIFRDHPDPETAQVIAPTIGREPFTLPAHGGDKDHTRATIKIQDGCDFFCSFCEIPYARGRARSRIFPDILKEAAALAAEGHKEIVLTGINLGTYANDDKQFLDVIDALCAIPQIARVRISSIEPTTVPDGLFSRMTEGGKLCRYLHIPLQSGSDPVLKMMKRKYALKEFTASITAAARVPGICVGTDIITGFPGETDAMFQETTDFLREAPIHYFHVFSYSERTMAKSKELSTAVPSAVIQTRSAVLRDLSQRKRRLFHQALLGTVQTVLFEQGKNGDWPGLTDNFIRVRARSTDDLRNRILPVRLTALSGQAVTGTILNPKEENAEPR